MASKNLSTLAYGANYRKSSPLNLRPGEIVEVRDLDEIAATLDEKGALEGLLFMPTMHKYSGRRFKVLRRADKIMIEGIGIRRVPNSVILKDTTCDGGTEECKRTCFPLWKEAWLKRTGEKTSTDEMAKRASTTSPSSIWEKTLHSGEFICQSGSLVDAGAPLSKWNVRRYMYDLTSGVYRPTEFLRTILVSILLRFRALLTRTNAAMSSRFSGGRRRTPTISLDLQPGDTVRVKTKEEIMQTLDYMGRNRGLEFTPEMEKYCGQTFKVLKRLDKMIIEQTGKMRQIANTVLLEGNFCDGKAHKGCPRNCYCLWREIWLEKIQNHPPTA